MSGHATPRLPARGPGNTQPPDGSLAGRRLARAGNDRRESGLILPHGRVGSEAGLLQAARNDPTRAGPAVVKNWRTQRYSVFKRPQLEVRAGVFSLHTVKNCSPA